MKKHLLLLTLAFGLVTAVAAQKEEKNVTPPASVKAAFEKAFPGATKTTWEKEEGNFEAGFTDKGKKMAAVYSPKGALQETEVSINVTELPPPVTDYMKQHYKGIKIQEAAKITKADGTINYEAEVNKKDVVFDAKGHFIKEVKD
jgi:hypothetical protein